MSSKIDAKLSHKGEDGELGGNPQTGAVRAEAGENWSRGLLAGRSWERFLEWGLAGLSAIPISITVAIAAVLVYESFLFFQSVSPWQFFADSQWSPMIGEPRYYGIFVLATATFLVTAIASLVAIPIGILGATYLSEYSGAGTRRFLKPALEALSGIPTVVYGYFALLFVTPLLQTILPFELGTFNALSAGLVVGILLAPTISSLSEDALSSVPDDLREGAYALGFSKSEAIVRILIPAAWPGIMASIALAISRALGETMIVAIAAGQFANLTLNPLVPIQTMTAFIIQVSQGTPPEFATVEFQTIFTVGMTLFIVTLILNSLGNWLTRRSDSQLSQMFAPQAAAIAESNEGETTVIERRRSRSAGEMLQYPSSITPPTVEKDRQRLWLERGFQSISLLAAFMGIIVLGVLFFDLAEAGLERIDWQFLTSIASRKPEESGIFVPLMGSLWVVVLTGIFAIPIGIGAAIYLEEYYPDNWFDRLIEINISNLAAVPSIIYGLLGLELFVRLLGPITGTYSVLSAALTLTAIVLPVLIIASRSALGAVPTSLRNGGYAIGMTKVQLLRYIILPAALPRLFTGILLSLSLVVAETAAVIAVGAAASVYNSPFFNPLKPIETWLNGIQSPYTVLPVQIFHWLQSPNEDVRANAAAATIVLVAIVLAINVAAVLVRDFYDRRRPLRG